MTQQIKWTFARADMLQTCYGEVANKTGFNATVHVCMCADRLSCDVLTVSLSTSESADNSRTRCPDLSRPIKSFSVKYT